MKTDKKQIGDLGEDVAAYYLKKNGYNILKRNFRIKGGEIDIIAVKDGVIAFTEVKTRSPDPLVSGFEAVTPKKQKLIINASEQYSIRYPHNFQPRFDVALVTVSEGKIVGFSYVENAFDASK